MRVPTGTGADDVGPHFGLGPSRSGPHAMHVDAELVVWNDVACGVQFHVGDKQLRCWVWANALTLVP